MRCFFQRQKQHCFQWRGNRVETRSNQDFSNHLATFRRFHFFSLFFNWSILWNPCFFYFRIYLSIFVLFLHFKRRRILLMSLSCLIIVFKDLYFKLLVFIFYDMILLFLALLLASCLHFFFFSLRLLIVFIFTLIPKKRLKIFSRHRNIGNHVIRDFIAFTYFCLATLIRVEFIDPSLSRINFEQSTKNFFNSFRYFGDARLLMNFRIDGENFFIWYHNFQSELCHKSISFIQQNETLIFQQSIKYKQIECINHIFKTTLQLFFCYMITGNSLKLSSYLTRVFARNFAFQKFDYQDGLNFKSLLNDEELMVIDNAKKFADTHLMPRVIEDNRNQSFDPKIMKLMGENGFLGCTLSEYGLPGLSYTSYGLINREIQRVDSAYRSALSVQSSLVIHPINQFGSKEQKDKYLPGLSSGELIGCFGLTQPDHGSDPGSMKTRARLVGDEYILTGSKMWITNSPIADVFVVWAKDQNGDVRGFILEKGMKGLQANKINGKLSLKASITGDIVMDEVKVPKSHMFTTVKGLKGPFSCLNNARFGISWGTLGAAQFCFHRARQYVLDRHQFDVPLASFQLIQKKLADMQADIALGLLGILQVSRLKENGQLAVQQISIMKRNNCMKAIQIARDAREMMGGNGISEEYHVLRHAINLETVNTYEGTNDIHALTVGRAITGIEAFTRNLKK